MIILMANPWRHPKTGMLYYRGRVPADLRNELRRKSISVSVGGEPSVLTFGETCKVSLRTKNTTEAKTRFAEVQNQLLSYWDATRQGAVALSFEQVCALAGELYRDTLAGHETNPGSAADWEFLQGQLLDALAHFERDEDGRPFNAKQGEVEVSKLAGTERFLSLRGLRLTSNCYRQFVEQAGGALWRAYGVLARRASGDYSRDEDALRFPVWLGVPSEDAPTTEADLLALFEAWAAEAKPVPATYRGWKPYIEDFIRHAGHANAARFTRADVVGWKDQLVARGDAVKTINDSKLAALRRVLAWAVDNGRITANPAAGVTVRQRRKPGEGMKEFTELEAAAIFGAAERESDPLLRWVPVICALSGARVSEICQLRAEDVQSEEGIHFIEITAQAGSVKNLNSERRVPLHPHLIETGFLEFVREHVSGPLFYDPKRRKANATTRPAKIAAKDIAAWVRGLGLDVGRAHRKDPNHAWRHRFIALAREEDAVKEAVLMRLVGQAPKNVHQGYGSASLRTLARAVQAVPVPRLTGEQ